MKQERLFTTTTELRNSYRSISDEIHKAEKKFPEWPIDIVHGAAILTEEAGEVIKASLDFYYGRGNREDLIKEVVQTAAMATRLLIFLKRNKKWKSDSGSSQTEGQKSQ
jgi:hypothetical protein